VNCRREVPKADSPLTPPRAAMVQDASTAAKVIDVWEERAWRRGKADLVGTIKHCPLLDPTHCEPSCLDFNGTILR
jgi:hypothetical protein